MCTFSCAFRTGGCKSELFSFIIRSTEAKAREVRAAGSAMYVCICNRVTDRDLLDAAAQAGLDATGHDPATLGERVAEQAGVGLQCGCCREHAVGLVESVLAARKLGRVA